MSDDTPTAENLAPQLLIFAGPNGAGKTTFAASFLPPRIEFVNADEIAKRLSPTNSAARDRVAGRRAVERFRDLAGGRRDFAVETTLSGRALAGRIAMAKDAGYEVHLTFLFLPTAAAAIERVRDRVAQGGHDIPADVIRRRYAAGLALFIATYSKIATTWQLIDNGSRGYPIRIAEMFRDGKIHVFDHKRWEQINDEFRDRG